MCTCSMRVGVSVLVAIVGVQVTRDRVTIALLVQYSSVLLSLLMCVFVGWEGYAGRWLVGYVAVATWE